MNQRAFISQIGAVLSGATAHRIASLVATLFAAQLLSTAAFGQLLATLALLQLTAIVFDLGLEIWLLKQTQPEAHFGNVLILRVGIGASWLGLMYGAASWLASDLYPPSLVLLAASFIWGEGILQTYLAFFKSQLQNQSTLRVSLVTAISTIAGIGALFLLDTVTSHQILIARLLPVGLGVGLAIWINRNAPLHIDLQQLPQLVRSCPPYALSVLLAVAYTYADITIVANLSGLEAAGHYGLATRVLTALFLLPHSIYSVFVPLLSKSQAALGQWRRRNYSIQAVVGLGLTLSTLLLLWIGGPYVPAKYSVAAQLLGWLSLILVARGISFAAAALLVAGGWQSQRVGVQAVIACINIAATVWAATTGTLIIVGIVYVLSEFGLATGYYLLENRHWKNSTLPAG